MNIKSVISVVISTFIISACSSSLSGSEYIGKWKDKSGHIAEFVKDGDAIFLVIPDGKKFPATINKDNTLQVAGAMGNMTLSYAKSSDSIFSGGEELKRVK